MNDEQRAEQYAQMAISKLNIHSLALRKFVLDALKAAWLAGKSQSD